MESPGKAEGYLVWAEESGVEVQAERIEGFVRIRIIKDGMLITTATLGEWRWQNIVRTVAQAPTAPFNVGKEMIQQEISTAPKDGRTLILISPTGTGGWEIWDGKWSCWRRRFIETGRRYSNGRRDRSKLNAPEFWMPSFWQP